MDDLLLIPDDGSAVPIITSHFIKKDRTMRAVVGLTCCLSILGSLLIILSFILQKKRTKAREILFHISLMDFGVGMANLIGLTVYFDRFYGDGKYVPAYIDNLCKTQAFFAAYCTLASIYWTTALAGYLYVVILYHRKPSVSLYYVRFCYFLCYGLAFIISLWLVLIGKLGYSPYNSTGWCSLVAKDPNLPPSGFYNQVRKNDLFVTIFANDLWIYLSSLLIIVLYIAIKGLLSNQLKNAKDNLNISATKFWLTMNSVDYKFILIPVIFVLLRMWSCILTAVFIFASVKESDIISPIVVNILLYLSGIGDSAQGFTNAILFIFFTKSMRERFIEWLCCRCKNNDAKTELSTSNASAHTQTGLEENKKQSNVSSLLYRNNVSEDRSLFQS